mmetsp:Transcript_132781/g.424926  ORF Transcript_132781/g.424926 Transcript_132781/m.424926 type:complete len:1192 (-) Transcript_132781:467-4042(-)
MIARIIACGASFAFFIVSCAAFDTNRAGSGSAGTLPHSLHRVIVRYDKASVDHSLPEQIALLQVEPGVLKAQALPHVGMAVVSLDSSAAAEQLVRKLEQHASSVLAVPDTWVTAFDFGARTAQQRRASPPGACSANPACRMRGLIVGDCCPVADGTMLSCCSSRVQDLLMLRSIHGTFISAGESGTLSQVSAPAASSSVFEISANDDGTVSLRSQSGRYLMADERGDIHATGEQIGNTTKFSITRNTDGTVSVSSSFGLYLTADKSGALAVNRAQALGWEQFTIVDKAAPGQRVGNDPEMSRLWAMQDYGGFDIDVPEAWNIWTGEVGKGITVAVIDTGIDYTHEDLREQMWVNPLEIPGNGIDDDQNGIVDDIHGADFANQDGDPMDDMMHGTHCAGTIAGVGNDRQGVAGVAWRGVRLMALKFLDSAGAGRVSDAIQAIDYAVAQGAKIASNSWGGGGSNPALRMAIEHAEAAGMLFTAAAGNEGNDNDVTPSYPANVDCANVISVASTTWLGAVSTFSNTGVHTVHVAAPGSDIYSTVPGGGYRRLSGTSMAAPHVTGMAALVWMYRPQLSMHQVKDIVLGSVRKLSSLEGKISTGGLINAKNALEAAWAFAPPQPPAHAPLALAFEDVDPNIAVYGGTVTVTAAADESDIEYYRIYFVSGAGFQLQGLGEPIPATGASEYTLKVNGSFVPSTYARYLVAVSGRAIGELPAQLQGSAPRVALKDYGRPISGARALRWTGDADRRLGFIQGSLVFDRALNEASVTNYNVYWRMADGSRGPMLGSIDGAGFREPACTGRTCPFINGSRTAAGGFRFERGAYAESEEATISTFGPGRVNVLRFDTEEVYDSLKIGSDEVSGNLSGSVPFVKEFPEGPLNIAWKSDESMQGGGWSIEIFDASPSVEFKINTTALLGSGFEVVAAYGENELQSHVAFVRVMDNVPGHASEPMAAVVPTTGRGLAASSSNGGGAAEPAKATAPSKQGRDRWHTGQGESEPWLPRRETTGNYGRVHWSESVFRRERGSVVRSSFVVQGLAPEVASQPATRAELVRAFATSQTLKDASVRLVSIAAVGDSEAVEGSVAAKIVFEVEGPSGASTAASDRVESALISLAAGGRATSRFDAALGAALAPSPADGAALASAAAALSCRFGASQPLSAMMLAAEAELLAATQATPAPEGRKLRGAVPYVFA